MSRDRHCDRKFHTPVDHDADVIDVATRTFGSEAATAIAYCGIDAWFEGRDEDVARCSKLLERLRN